MFNNLTIKHNADFDYDDVSFDINEGFMSKMWAMFGIDAPRTEIPGVGVPHMTDGEEDIYLVLDAGAATIRLCMENQRCWIGLPAEQDAEDGTVVLGVDANWVRFVPIMRWIKELN